MKTSKPNVLLSSGAQSTRGVISFFGSLLAAASGATLASSAPAWGNLPRGAHVTPAQGNTAPLDMNIGYSMLTP